MSQTAPDPIANARELPRWEVRSVDRALQSGDNKILGRSRKLVEAARELLEQQGLDGLTVRAVLKKTGLSRAAFYERFAGKDDLMLAVFEQLMRQAAQLYEADIEALSDPLERLRVIIVTLIAGKRVDRAIADTSRYRYGLAISREHLRLAESRPEELRQALAPFVALLARQLADGMETGVIRQGDPEEMAIFIYNLVSTTMHTEILSTAAVHADRRHREQLAERLWEFCRRAITI